MPFVCGLMTAAQSPLVLKASSKSHAELRAATAVRLTAVRDARDNWRVRVHATFARIIMQAKVARYGPHLRPFNLVVHGINRMEPMRASEQSSVSVIRNEVAESWPPVGVSSLERIKMALDAATGSLDDAREDLQRLSEAIQNGASGPWSGHPTLLTVPQVCGLLGYHKTKVYGLMKRGLLPYLLDRKTGRRRVEYRAVQHFIKRLRVRRLERSAS